MYRFSYRSASTRAQSIRILCLAALSAFAIKPSAAIPPEQVEFFESRIRPILAQDCYECHSTATKQKGGLNLDHRAAWQSGGASGAVIVPGKPNDSLLLQAIRHDDEDLTMPKSGAKLDRAIIQDFTQWIAMGAPDPRDSPPSPDQIAQDQDWDAVMERRKKWWSFQPITNPEPPQNSWSNHPVDRFLEAGRSAANLEAAPLADPQILVRRLYFTLIGLPPTPDQVDEFLQAHADNPARAVTTQVDELLASPRFGERWARHWMDWIRYAESHGSEGDPRIANAHLYRDYLIRALNDDIPYDQLVREHVAGDQLESPRLNQELEINESLIGTAHWRMVFHGFAPTDALDEKVRFTDDQINVFSKAFLGLTVSCARCHNHKFDAISQADYYAFFGIMGSTRPGRKAIDLPEKQERHREALIQLKPKIRSAIADDWQESLNALSDQLQDPEGPVAKAEAKHAFLNPLQALRTAEDASATAKDLREAWKADDQAWEAHRARGYAQSWNLGNAEHREQWYTEGTGLRAGASAPGDFSIAGEAGTVLTGIHPRGTYTHTVSSKHGGLLTSPDISLDEDYEVWLRLKGANRSMSRYVVFNYPRNGTVYPVQEMRDDDTKKWHWRRYNVDYWRGDDIHLEVTTAADAPLLVRDDERSWFGIREALLVKKGTPTPPDRPRRYLAPVFAALGDSPLNAQSLQKAYRTAIENAIKDWAEETLTDDQAELLDACLRLKLLPNTLDTLPTASPLILSYRELENDIPVPTRVPTVAEWIAKDQPLYDRGNHKKPLATVPRRFLEAIDSAGYKTPLSGRRELAEDLLRDDNPLARRVMVNRIWHHLFGQGIVSTPDNFGRLGAEPTHPELLDHLASYFSNQADWSIKRLVRYLVTTKTWQLDSAPSEAAQQSDPANELLSHFSVRRLEAEAIRDSLLHVSDRLNLDAFGRAVDGNKPRRSVYVKVIRNSLDSFLSAFDAPVPFSAQGRRNVTTVPGQSLLMMNGNFAVDTARHWGADLARSAETTEPAAVIEQAWKRAFGRPPTPQEKYQSLTFLEQQKADYQTFESALNIARLGYEAAEKEQSKLMALAQKRLQPKEKTENESSAFLKPIAQWLFDTGAQDSIGSLNLSLEGSARIEDGALILDGGDSLAVSPTLTQDLTTKSLEVWVQLNGLKQRGGGAITIQTPDGVVFDSIVFAERQQARWMAGSNNFARTEDFNGPEEKAAREEPVHVVITYGSDGTITGYRNGEVYGKPYKSNGPNPFKNGKAEVLFGVRHGSPSNSNTLRGRIFEARLYDRSLTAEEISAAAVRKTDYVSQEDLIAALTPEEQSQWTEWSQKLKENRATVDRLKEIAPRSWPKEVWNDLALAIFNMKEFIYVR